MGVRRYLDSNQYILRWQYSSSSDVVKRINCGMKGRYVTVVTRDETKPITLCELEVFAGGELCLAMLQ